MKKVEIEISERSIKVLSSFRETGEKVVRDQKRKLNLLRAACEFLVDSVGEYCDEGDYKGAKKESLNMAKTELDGTEAGIAEEEEMIELFKLIEAKYAAVVAEPEVVSV